MIAALDKFLNAVYRYCGYAAAVFIVLICVMVVINIVDRIFGGYTAGTNEFAAYCVGAAGAMGLAYTLGQGRHIRMSLLVDRTGGRFRRFLDVLALLIAAGFSLFMSYYLTRMVLVSAQINDVSTGTDGVPLWIPQLPMALGFVIFSVALLHSLVRELYSSWSR